jgi:MYXO-CTERM domain-containing protein
MAPQRLVLLAALAALLLLAPFGQAAYSYGSIVDKNDYDFQPVPAVRGTVPAAGKWVVPCFVDLDGNALPNDDGEHVYLAVRNGLAATCSEVREKDVRLTAVGPYAAGTESKGWVDVDATTGLTQLGTPGVPLHAIRVFNDGDNALTLRKTDAVYLDLTNLGNLQVDVGDIRLSAAQGYKAGTRVMAGDKDVNFPLFELNGGATKTFYTANMVYEFGKSWYLNADLDAAAGGAVEEGDLRLTATVPNPFADVAAGFGNPGQTVDGLSLSPDVAKPGQLVLATITVKNPTTKVGSGLVKTSVDGVVVDARGTPTLAQNEVASLVVPFFAPQEPGRHKVQAGDYTFFLDVVGAVASTSTEAPSTSAAPAVNAASVQGAPGPMPFTVLALVVLGALALRRRAA